MFIGTDNFSNCKACGKKVPIRLRNCPHCREPDPQLRNCLGWRVNYTKSLDPTVPEKSPWPFRIPSGTRFTILSFIAIIAAAIATDFFVPDLAIELFGLSDESAKVWQGLLHMVMFVVLAICMAAVLKRED